ncbi:protein of unknown function [Malonomonas rubra DSM 5091]|uniref:DUF4124 domain-containing protein n=1 Tax=Malonomonas rubra DSM 5091 TaxID=1122189 RepID=A0A1M6FGA8_MALRU|nr:DUF4124 domain-containing protein [Malonomonas rubra]SHI96642.1 protein of unknown function [Malonomonas rubra DSM 5091]
MRILLLLSIFLCLSLPVAAKTYSCRDSAGQIHFSDNLQGLPEECLGKEQVVKPGPIDNLQYVPATKLPAQADRDFQRAVRRVEREERLKSETAARFKQEAEELHRNYLQIKDEMSRARRIWDNRSRQKLKQLKIDLADLVGEKEELLLEIEEQNLASQDRQEIEAILQDIKNK